MGQQGIDPFTILVVCAANICRSPATQALFVDRLGDLVSDGRVDLRSAGVRAAAGAPSCRIAGELLRLGPAGRTVFDTHRAGVVTPAELDRADLILTADRGQRGELISLDPTGRRKVFTLTEAARLATDTTEHERPLSTAPAGADPSSIVRQLNNRRGRTSVPEPSNAGSFPPWRRRAPLHPDDIADCHTVGAARHPATLEAIERAVAQLVDAFAASLGCPTPSPAATTSGDGRPPGSRSRTAPAELPSRESRARF